MRAARSLLIRLFLSGDVMTGRGIDQILPHPGNPVLDEPLVHDAREYVRLAEAARGPIQRPVEFEYIWGDALYVLRQAGTHVRIINLETSIACGGDPWPDKIVHYRMHPRNVGCITAARIDCCCLANNHVLDWGHTGLEETLQTLDAAGVAHAGAGRTVAEAAAPATINVQGRGRVLVFSLGSPTSGIPPEWGAREHAPGINLLRSLNEDAIRGWSSRIRQVKRPGDVTVVSIHWGSNWGYAIPDEQVDFAHRLVEEGVDIVYGHSSHHVRAIELYRGHLILYGCGDLLNDYEGIGGYEEFRSDLALMYLAAVDSCTGELAEGRLVPMQVRRFRLQRASESDAQWLSNLLNELGAPFRTRVQLESDNTMTLRCR